MSAQPAPPRARGAPIVVAQLPNGRALWLSLDPAPVDLREMDRLAAAIGRADARQARALGEHGRSARKLTRALKRDVARLTRAALAQNRRLGRRGLAGDRKVDWRIEGELKATGLRARANLKREAGQLRRGGRRDLWDQLTVASALPLMAAYGQRSHPLAENNLAMALALGVWLVGDEVSDLLAGRDALAADPPRGSDLWSYTAPFANLLTGWWLLSGRQHERFVTGITDLKGFTVVPKWSMATDARGNPIERTDLFLAQVDLSPRIAPEHLADFQSFAQVPALATLRSVEFADVWASSSPRIELLAAEVKFGSLWLSVQVTVSTALPGVSGESDADSSPILSRLEVAWAVDTQQPAAAVG